MVCKAGALHYQVYLPLWLMEQTSAQYLLGCHLVVTGCFRLVPVKREAVSTTAHPATELRNSGQSVLIWLSQPGGDVSPTAVRAEMQRVKGVSPFYTLQRGIPGCMLPMWHHPVVRTPIYHNCYHNNHFPPNHSLVWHDAKLHFTNQDGGSTFPLQIFEVAVIHLKLC